MNHLLSAEVTLPKLFVPLLKMVYSKRKEFAPLESKFFPFRVDPFSEGAWYVGNKQEFAEVVTLVKMAANQNP